LELVLTFFESFSRSVDLATYIAADYPLSQITIAFLAIRLFLSCLSSQTSLKTRASSETIKRVINNFQGICSAFKARVKRIEKLHNSPEHREADGRNLAEYQHVRQKYLSYVDKHRSLLDLCKRDVGHSAATTTTPLTLEQSRTLFRLLVVASVFSIAPGRAENWPSLKIVARQPVIGDGANEIYVDHQSNQIIVLFSDFKSSE
jgi:hypothetical protein